MRILTSLFMLGLSLLLFSLPAQAHFLQDAKARIIHLAPMEDGEGLKLFLRIPGPFAYAKSMSRRAGPTAAVEAPFLTRTMVQGVPFFVLDQQAIKQDEQGFARFLASGYRLTSNGQTVNAKLDRFAYFIKDENLPHFSNLEEGEAALSAFADMRTDLSKQDIYIAEAVFDLELTLPGVKSWDQIDIQNVLPEIRIPPTISVENLILDHRFDPPRAIKMSGQLKEPVTFNPSWLASFANFVWQGVVHIAIGLDHVLFVICLALAAGISQKIIWSVTGFTLGHSVTLFLGSVGIVPTGGWFIPMVELVIALSILLAAALVILEMRKRGQSKKTDNWVLFSVTAFVGLLHGYGFSFVLGDLLGGGISNLTLALVGFNLGVELGQLAIVLAIFALLWIARKIGASWQTRLSYAGVLIACYYAVLWTVERSQVLLSGEF